MNGDTPHKPAEGDWQAKPHDASPDETPAKVQPTEPSESTEQLDQPNQEAAVEQQPEGSTPELIDSPSPSNPAPAAWTTSVGDQDSMWAVADAEIEAHDQQETPSIEWTASEFIAHEKSPMWYLVLIIVGVLLTLFSFFVMHDMIAMVAVVFIIVLFGFTASHKPRTLPYRIDNTGVIIGGKLYPYGQFKSFGIVQEDAFSNITLMPLKRFGQPLTIYYPPEEEDNIVKTLSAYMPTAPVKLDFIDTTLRRIRL